jgi:hypothetical protein
MADTKSLVEIARERYKRGIDADNDNRKHALEVLKFRNLEHWDPAIKHARENDPEGSRPCPVVDKTGQHFKQVCNDQRKNRPAIKIRPVDDKSDPKVAQIYQGLIRNIEDQSSADIAYDTAYEQAADAGFGYMRILAEYCDEMSFDQDLRIKRVRNRFQVVMDPDRQEPDGSDAKWVFVVEKMHKDDYEAQYGKEHPINWDTDGIAFKDWVEKEHCLVAEYFRIETEQKKLFQWADGSTTLEGQMPSVPLMPMLKDGKQVERKTEIRKVKWSKINGKEELESRDLPGKWIPIVEVIGDELDIEGKSIKSGLFKPAMEPQRIHDYAAASFIENVALAPKAPWVGAAEQIDGYEDIWRTANRRNIAYLPYKPVLLDGNVQVPPPQRSAPPGIPVGWQVTLQNTEHDVQAAMGRYNASLGAETNEKSGIALQRKQNEADNSTFHYMDNLARSIRHVGRILVDLIPHYYDTARQARILGEDGEPSMVMLNPGQGQPVMKTEQGESYDITVGKYDVTVATGPSFTTKRQEAAEFMANVAAAAKDPATVQVATYLAVKNSDMAGAEEATQMIKKLLPPGIVEEEGQEDVPTVQTPQGPMPLPQAEQFLAQLMQQIQAAEDEIRKAGDLQQMEQGVKDEMAQLEKGKVELKAMMDGIAAARRELALAQRLVEEQLKNQELQAKSALQQQANAVQRDGEQVNAARKELDGILDQEVAVSG